MSAQTPPGMMCIPGGDWMAFAAKWLAAFKEFPQRQKSASFNLDEVMQTLTEPNHRTN